MRKKKQPTKYEIEPVYQTCAVTGILGLILVALQTVLEVDLIYALGLTNPAVAVGLVAIVISVIIAYQRKCVEKK